MANRETIENILSYLKDTHPAEWDRWRGMTVKENTRIIENWMRTLGPVPDDLLWAAAVVVGRSPGAFLPSAGDLYNTALDLADDSPGVAEAWALVLLKARGDDVVLPERVKRALAAVGADCRNWNPKEFSIKQAIFRNEYEAARQSWKRQAALPGTDFPRLTDGRD